ncbi:MAG: hypothetical protein GY722_10415, partial [bacterium]|nr:hypothetical protein [bacterium]
MRYALVGFLITLLVSGTMTLAAAENGLESVDLSQLRDQHCEVLSMACNSTASDTLDSSDCTFRDATYFDIWEFEGTAGQTVVIDLISYSSDAVLFLADPNEQVVATDDDSGVGSNSRIVRVLESSGTWSIISNHLLFHSFGGYTLQLQCS